ncbi:Uma2 family endonuclease [Terriglobus sp.]|uniref:Uma2 family endonuclease n=1 Tax=Terriglobus sp. TaxID=1889013 RepID=UPI003B000ABF
MATTALISAEEYLSTSYRPDCDYVDGEVQERNLGERWHSSVQSMIAAIFAQHRHEWKLTPLTEQRVQVSPTRFRIPDVCVVPVSDPFTSILHTAPLLCVEILSTEDRFSRILERVEEYLQMGVPHVWIIDPRSREIWTVEQDGRPVPFPGVELTLPNTSVRIATPEIFALIDESPAPSQP